MNELAKHPMQSLAWGEARKKMGITVERFTDGNDVFQFTIHPIPYTPFAIGYLPRSVVPNQHIVDQLVDYGNKNKLVCIKLEPYVAYDDSTLSDLVKRNDRLVVSPHGLFPEWTQMLDITISEDDLLKNCKSKTRYNIRLAQKKGVSVQEMSNDEGYAIFEKLYFETCRRQKYHGHTPFYHRTLWNSLKAEQAHILIAFLGKEPLAAYELLEFKKKIYYLYGGSSVSNKNVMAPNLLMWEAIRLGKSLGAEEFDMWGSLSPSYPETHSWAGFTRFKEGYGTRFVHLSQSYDLVIHPTLYKIYNAAYSIREKLL